MYFIGDEIKYLYPGANTRLNKIKLSWKMTDWCNYSCPYCIQITNRFNGLQPKESQEYVEKIAKILRGKFHNQNVELTIYGGEISTFYDLSKICNILFKDNDSDARIILVTNLSAPIKKYEDLIKISNKKMRIKIIPSYQWVDINVFLEKCKKIYTNIAQVTCVVYDKTNLKQLKNITEKFKEANIPLRLTFARIPNSKNQFSKFQDGVEDFVKYWNENYLIGAKCHIVLTNNNKLDNLCKTNVLKEIADKQGQSRANFKGMFCMTGLRLLPNGDIFAGSCEDRKIFLGNILKDDITLKNYMAKCNGLGGCSFCCAVFIWNGKY